MAKPKEQLSLLINEAGHLLNVATAASVFNISNLKAAKILSRWTAQGWSTRIRRSLYAVVPIEALDSQQMLEEPWAIIPDLFSPCYVGGWSAAEYWDFTEQLFNNICVLTEKPVIHKRQKIHNIQFILTHISKGLNFGTKTTWKENKKIQVSDPHKTIVDMLYNPQLGGGIQHTIDCFKEYSKSKHYDPEQLLAYAEEMKNGAVFKRLGFLSSQLISNEDALVRKCHEQLTKGVAYLDPSLKGGKLVTHWRLFIPNNFEALLSK